MPEETAGRRFLILSHDSVTTLAILQEQPITKKQAPNLVFIPSGTA